MDKLSIERSAQNFVFRGKLNFRNSVGKNTSGKDES